MISLDRVRSDARTAQQRPEAHPRLPEIERCTAMASHMASHVKRDRQAASDEASPAPKRQKPNSRPSLQCREEAALVIQKAWGEHRRYESEKVTTERLRNDSKICHRIISLDPRDLIIQRDGGMLFKAGDRVLYTGKPQLLTASNGISSLRSDGKALYLQPGTRLIVCKNQYGKDGVLTYQGLLGHHRIRCHFRLEAIQKEQHGFNCRCGACGHAWNVIDCGECACEQEEPIDAGKQQCIIS